MWKCVQFSVFQFERTIVQFQKHLTKRPYKKLIYQFNIFLLIYFDKQFTRAK